MLLNHLKQQLQAQMNDPAIASSKNLAPGFNLPKGSTTHDEPEEDIEQTKNLSNKVYWLVIAIVSYFSFSYLHKYVGKYC